MRVSQLQTGFLGASLYQDQHCSLEPLTNINGFCSFLYAAAQFTMALHACEFEDVGPTCNVARILDFEHSYVDASVVGLKLQGTGLGFRV